MAKDAGLDSRKVDEAMDARDAKEAIIDLLCGGQSDGGSMDAGGSRGGGGGLSKRDLEDKRTSELETMAQDAGVERHELDRAMDSRNPKEEVIDLILAADNGGGGGRGGGGGGGGGGFSKRDLEDKR